MQLKTILEDYKDHKERMLVLVASWPVTKRFYIVKTIKKLLKDSKNNFFLHAPQIPKWIKIEYNIFIIRKLLIFLPSYEIAIFY